MPSPSWYIYKSTPAHKAQGSLQKMEEEWMGKSVALDNYRETIFSGPSKAAENMDSQQCDSMQKNMQAQSQNKS